MSLITATNVTASAVPGATSLVFVESADSFAHGKFDLQFKYDSFTGTLSGLVGNTKVTPFTSSLTLPSVYQKAPTQNAITGVYSKPKTNTYKFVHRKAVAVTPGGAQTETAIVRITYELPAGCELHDAPNLKALVGLVGGFHSLHSTDIANLLLTGSVS